MIEKLSLRTGFERLLRPFASNLGIELYEAGVLLVTVTERKACSAMPRQVSEFFSQDSNAAIETELLIIESAKTGNLAKFLDVDDQMSIRNSCYVLKVDALNKFYEALNKF